LAQNADFFEKYFFNFEGMPGRSNGPLTEEARKTINELLIKS
jgi:hypothetical protein